MEMTREWAYILLFLGITANTLILDGCFLKPKGLSILLPTIGSFLGMAFATGIFFFAIASPRLQAISWDETGKMSVST